MSLSYVIKGFCQCSDNRAYEYKLYFFQLLYHNIGCFADNFNLMHFH